MFHLHQSDHKRGSGISIASKQKKNVYIFFILSYIKSIFPGQIAPHEGAHFTQTGEKLR